MTNRALGWNMWSDRNGSSCYTMAQRTVGDFQQALWWLASDSSHRLEHSQQAGNQVIPISEHIDLMGHCNTIVVGQGSDIFSLLIKEIIFHQIIIFLHINIVMVIICLLHVISWFQSRKLCWTQCDNTPALTKKNILKFFPWSSVFTVITKII